MRGGSCGGLGSDSLVTSAATGLSGGAEAAGDFGDAVEKGGGFAGFGGAREGQVDGEVVGDAAGGEDDDAGRKEDGFGDGVGDEDGGPALAHFTHALVIDGVDSAAIQEAHQMIMHILCEACEHFSAPVR